MRGDRSEHDGQARPIGTGLTWAVLLGRWLDFARSVRALAPNEAGRRLRDSVPDIIVLQAVWFSLQELEQLDRAQQAVGLDRSQILIEKHAANLQRRFNPVPRQIGLLIQEAEDQLHQQQRRHAAG